MLVVRRFFPEKQLKPKQLRQLALHVLTEPTTNAVLSVFWGGMLGQAPRCAG
jgi:hypothetical protein